MKPLRVSWLSILHFIMLLRTARAFRRTRPAWPLNRMLAAKKGDGEPKDVMSADFPPAPPMLDEDELRHLEANMNDFPPPPDFDFPEESPDVAAHAAAWDFGPAAWDVGPVAPDAGPADSGGGGERPQRSKEEITQGLNPSQSSAVCAPLDKVTVVSAGPGSGKTRVLTRRVAWLLATGVRPSQIMCVTFTNKAAAEMKERLGDLVGDERRSRQLTVGTFHSLCARILRSYAEKVEKVSNMQFSSDFTIYSQNDCIKVLKAVAAAADMKLPSSRAEVVKLVDRLQKYKEEEMECTILGKRPAKKTFMSVSINEEQLLKSYIAEMRAQNAVDFDDLILFVWLLLSKDPTSRAALQDRFRHILVDEWQDTNISQYSIVKLLFPETLEGEPHSLFVVGDMDQSIYGWRGAAKDTMGKLMRDFRSRTDRYHLKENYRSTKEITTVASAILSKDSVTSSIPGSSSRPVRVVRLEDDEEQASFIANEIEYVLAGQDVAQTGTVLNGLQKTLRKVKVVEEVKVALKDLGGLCQSPRRGQQVAIRDADVRDLWHRAEIVSTRRETGRKKYECVVKYLDNGDEESLTLPDPDVRTIKEAAAPSVRLQADTREWICGILYRTNAQSRALEAALSKRDIRYVLQGSFAFFSRKEILDVLSYLRLLVNPNDQVAFTRAVNYPPRGCGDATVKAFLEWNPESTISEKLDVLIKLSETGEEKKGKGRKKKDQSEVGEEANGIECPLNSRQRKALLSFALIWKQLSEKVASSSPAQLVAQVCELAKVREQIQLDAQTPREADDRIENLVELMAFASGLSSDVLDEMDLGLPSEEEDDPIDTSILAESEEDEVVGEDALRLFVQKADLSTDTSDSSNEDGVAPVRLMTIHASKGLEFDAVWLTGADEGCIPIKLEDTDIAEERRLLYVGATRAKECLTITCRAKRRQALPARNRDAPTAQVSQFLAGLRNDDTLRKDVIQWDDVSGRNWEADEESSESASEHEYFYKKVKAKKNSSRG